MLPLLPTCHCCAVPPVHVDRITRVPLAVPGALRHLPLCGLTSAPLVEMVLDLAFGAELSSKRRELGTELVVRSSTAVPAR